MSLGEFRSISLVENMYKILAKPLADRLNKVLYEVIHKRQSIFLSNRFLLHSTLIANEVVDEARRLKKKCIVFKVDYEKAYSSFDGEFLFYMLRRLDFYER